MKKTAFIERVYSEWILGTPEWVRERAISKKTHLTMNNLKIKEIIEKILLRIKFITQHKSKFF